MGLKSGSGDSKLGDADDDDENTANAASTEPGSSAGEPAASSERSGASSDSGAPGVGGAARAQESYLRRRDSTRDGRTLIQFFAREEKYSSNDEDILKGRVGKRVENPVEREFYDMDLREAMLAAWKRNEDELIDDVVDELVEMGYERKE